MSFNKPQGIESKKTPEGKIKKGVDFVFEQNQELAKIGTREEYFKYLKTIFPKSSTHEIYYRGQTTRYNFENDLNDEDTSHYEYCFAPTVEEATYWGKMKTDTEEEVIREWNDNPKNTNIRECYSTLKEAIANNTQIKIHPAILNNPREGEVNGWALRDNKRHMEYVADVKDIYLLGSKKDLEGFKNFVSKKKEK